MPELVSADANGSLAIDYIGFIPLIVESLKEQQAQIDYLTELLGEKNAQLRSYNSINEQNLSDDAKLFDASGASVDYRLPVSYTTAGLQIYDVAGKLVKKVALNNNSSTVSLSSSDIGYGMFVYELIVDDQRRDTLKKYVNK